MKEEEDLVHQTVIAHLPLYMWGQSGELGETDYTDYGHPGKFLPCFNPSVSKWNVTSLGSLHYWGTET